MSKELLLFELEKTRGWTLDLFEGMKEEDMHIIPEGFPNSIHWQLGHIAGMMEMVTAALTDKNTDTSKRYQKYFGFGTSPDDFDGETPATDEIEALLKGQPELLEDLDEADEIDEGLLKLDELYAAIFPLRSFIYSSNIANS